MLTIRPAIARSQKRLFLTFPWRIYKRDPLWVPPLLPERQKAIDPQRGFFFKDGAAEFFIAWKDGQPAGTICLAEDCNFFYRKEISSPCAPLPGGEGLG